MKKLTAFLLCMATLIILPVRAVSAQDTEQEKNEAVISASVPSFHTVTIRTVGNTEVRLAGFSGSSFQVERLSEPVLEVTVPNGEILKKATVNGEDILSKIISGKYQLPPVYENLTILIQTKTQEETTAASTETVETTAVSAQSTVQTTEPSVITSDSTQESTEAAAAVSGVTVRFNSGDGVILLTVGADGKLVFPSPPKKKGYNFLGWYTDEACTKRFDAAKPITADLMLYAKWVEKTYQVTVTISGDIDAVDATTLNLLKERTVYQSAKVNDKGVYSFSNVMLGTYDLDVTIKSQKQSLSHLFSIEANDIE